MGARNSFRTISVAERIAAKDEWLERSRGSQLEDSGGKSCAGGAGDLLRNEFRAPWRSTHLGRAQLRIKKRNHKTGVRCS
jgi:hypothetical protein